MKNIFELLEHYREVGGVVTLDLIQRIRAEFDRLNARLAIQCECPEVSQCERLWAADHDRAQLEAVDPKLVDEFLFGCDTVQHMAAALLAARDEIARLRHGAIRDETPATEPDFANPPIEQVLQAVPMLQWRKCFRCGDVDLHSDNMGPACKCRKCGSYDTRHMLDECRLLHRRNDA